MNPIDKVLAEHNLEPLRYYDLAVLYTIMTDLGLVSMNRDSFTRDWFSRKVKIGKIVLPQKPAGIRWQLSGHQIKQIILSFAPGGEGKYDYREEANEQRS